MRAKPRRFSTTGDDAMDNLPSWVVTIAAVAVGVRPRLAILSTRLIARVLHLALWPRPKVTPMLGSEPASKNRPPFPGGAQGGLGQVDDRLDAREPRSGSSGGIRAVFQLGPHGRLPRLPCSARSSLSSSLSRSSF